MKLLPTPTGPTSRTCSLRSRNWREKAVEESSVECDGCGPVEVFEAAGLLEAGPLEAELEPPVISAVDLIGQYDLQEGCVVDLLPACESDSLRQGVEHGAELEALEQRGEFSRGGHERSPCAE